MNNSGFLVFAAFILLIITGLTMSSCDECNKRGGTLVRGVVWYTCVQAK